MNKKQKMRTILQLVQESLLLLALLFMAWEMVGAVGTEEKVISLPLRNAGLLFIGSGISALVVFAWNSQWQKLLKNVRRVVLALCILLALLKHTMIEQEMVKLFQILFYLFERRFGMELPVLQTDTAAPQGIFVLALIGGLLLALVLQWIVAGEKHLLFALADGALLMFYTVFLPEGDMVVLLLLFFAAMMEMLLSGGAKSMLQPSVWLRVLILTGACFVLTIALQGNVDTSYVRSSKEALSEGVEHLRYGTDTLPQGKFKDSTGLLEGNEERLSLSLSSPEAEEIYLRGYVGTTLTDTAWEEMDPSVYISHRGLLAGLQENDLDPLKQYAALLKTDMQVQAEESGKEELSKGPEAESIQVSNLHANRKYLYLPYTASGWNGDSFRENRDQQVKASGLRGARAYAFSYVEGPGDASKVSLPAWIHSGNSKVELQFLQTEDVYRQFVSEQYLQITEEEKRLIRSSLDLAFPTVKDIQNGILAGDMESFRLFTNDLRESLQSKIAYTESPDANPYTDMGFLTWILGEKREGNAVAYASAAVLAFRAAGIPARYAEGYHISMKDMESSLSGQGRSNDSIHTVTLTSQNAHAWAEVYLDGAGWMPVEVTPGFYRTGAEEPEMTAGGAKHDEAYAAEAELADTDEDSTEIILQRESASAPRKALYVVLTLIFLMLMLEVQRAVRLHRSRRFDKSAKQAAWYAGEIFRILSAGGVDIGKASSDMLESAAHCFAEVPGERLEEMVFLLQKARFSAVSLQAEECEKLEQIMGLLHKNLFSGKRLIRKGILRYRYLV